LHVQLPRGGRLKGIDLMVAMPCLTELSFIVTLREFVTLGGPHDDATYALPLQHQKLRHLTVSGEGRCRDLLRLIDPTALPELENIRLVGTFWGPLDWPLGVDRKPEYGIFRDIRMAIELDAKGIPLLDQDGIPFGNLARTRRV
jgi:hypothetical protein